MTLHTILRDVQSYTLVEELYSFKFSPLPIQIFLILAEDANCAWRNLSVTATFADARCYISLPYILVEAAFKQHQKLVRQVFLETKPQPYLRVSWFGGSFFFFRLTKIKRKNVGSKIWIHLFFYLFQYILITFHVLGIFIYLILWKKYSVGIRGW